MVSFSSTVWIVPAIISTVSYRLLWFVLVPVVWFVRFMNLVLIGNSTTRTKSETVLTHTRDDKRTAVQN